MKTTTHPVIFTIILSVCVLVPLTNDLFISSMPAMSLVFYGHNIAAVLSLSLLGLAVAQPFYGPLSDRFGRKPVLVGGLLLYIIASAPVMLAHTFTMLLIGRFFQALGVCSAIASALPIARDTCDQEELVNKTSLIMAIMSAGPALAPLLGSFLNHGWGWRASFIFLFTLGCVYLLWIVVFLKETHLNKNMQALNFRHIIHNYVNLAQQLNFLKFCLVSGLSYGVLFSYLSLAAFFIIQKLHFNVISFGFIVAANALAIITMAILAPKLIRKFTLEFTLQSGLVIIFASGILMWLVNKYIGENIYTFILPIFMATIGIGIIRTTATAGAMQLAQSKTAGSAAAFFNIFSFICGFIAISITTHFIHHAASFGIFMAMMGGTAWLIAKCFK